MTRMLETDRIRGWRRMLVIIDNITRHGRLTCEWCGDSVEYAPRIDHANPRALGGGHEFDNLVVSCEHCNTTKGDKPLTQQQRRHLAAINAYRKWLALDRNAARRIARYPNVTERINAAYVYAQHGFVE